MRFDITKFCLQVADTGVFTDFYATGCSNIEINQQPEVPLIEIAEIMVDTKTGGYVVEKHNEKYFLRAINMLKSSGGFHFFEASAQYPDKLNRVLRSVPYCDSDSKIIFAGEHN
jgi:hypothetical protein